MIETTTSRFRMRLYNEKAHRLYLNADERRRFEVAARDATDSMAALALTLLYTGCRISEALELSREVIQVDPGVITFRTLKRRSASYREVPVPDELAAQLLALATRPPHPESDKIFVHLLCPLRRITAYRWIKLLMADAGIHGAHACPTRQAELHLKGIGGPETVRPTGHWWHAFHTASMTSAIDIAAQRKGYRYIPAHEILNRSGATLAIPHGQQKLIPDQLFAIDYGGKFRSFVLEVDRGTEPITSKKARKSLLSMLRLYDEVWAMDEARRHYGLKSPLMVLCMFASNVRAQVVLELVRDLYGVRQHLLVQTTPNTFPKFDRISTPVAGSWKRWDGELVGVW